jgi:hypothetical protein
MKMNEYLPLYLMKRLLEVEVVVEDDDENQQNENVVDVYVPNDLFVYD